METGEETKKRILEASETLFCHYGFSKTTMRRLHKNVICPQPLYRFFEDKEEILAEMAGRHFSDVEAALEEGVRRPGMDSVARLEAFVLTIFNQAHTLTCCNEKMSEVVGFIQQRRADMVDRRWERMSFSRRHPFSRLPSA